MHKKIWRTAAAVIALAGATQASAATFVFTNATGGGAEVGTRARQGFDIAAAYWSSVLTNDVTINLAVGFSTLASTTLGSTGSTSTSVYNNAAYSALAASAVGSSTVDALAVANLRPLGPTGSTAAGVSALTFESNALNAAGNGYLDTATRIDNDTTGNNRGISLNTSVAKALGITTSFNGTAINYAAVDGSVTFNNLQGFDFDPTDGIDGDKFDFIGVAIHEIGHALGFTSGVDSFDTNTSPGSGTTATRSLETFINIGTILDYYRYGAPGLLNWSTQGTPYFSIDGGVSQLYGDSRFSTGRLNGDGRQASHFKDSPSMQPQLGVMDPTSGRGQLQEVTALDIAAFDAIGWRTSFDANLNSSYRFSTADAYRAFVANASPVVPEPATWALMIAGFGLVGGAMRRREASAALA